MDELPLWAAVRPEDPPFLLAPSYPSESMFKDFHEANPTVYTRIEEKALELLAAGRKRIGIAELVEDLRYDLKLRTKGSPFKLNNSYRAYYARLLIHRRPELAPLIETRKQKPKPAAG